MRPNLQKINLNNFVVSFFLGLTVILNFDFIGKFFLLEVIILILFIFTLKLHKLDARDKKFLKLIIMFMIIICFSNIYNLTSFNNSLKGLANFTLFVLVPFAIYYIYKDLKIGSFYAFMFGNLFGQIIGRFFFDLQLNFFANIWKWGIGLILILSFYLIIYIKDKRLNFLSLFFFIFLLVIISFMNNARSLALVLFVSFFLFYLSQKKIFVIKNSFLYILVLFLIFFSIGELPNLKIIKDNFPAVYERNLRDNPYAKNQIVASRNYIFIIDEIVKDSPIFGHGSYKKDVNLKYRTILNDYLYQNYYTDKIYSAKTEDSRLPGHNIIFQSVAENGLLTLFFWLPFLSIIISLVLKNPKYNNHYYFSFALVYFINTILFQPLGFTTRVELYPIIVSFFIFFKKDFHKNDKI